MNINTVHINASVIIIKIAIKKFMHVIKLHKTYNAEIIILISSLLNRCAYT